MFPKAAFFMEKDDKHSAYQTNFNDVYSAEKAKEVLQDWLKEFGYSDDEIKKIDGIAFENMNKEALEFTMNSVFKQLLRLSRRLLFLR